MKMDARNEIGNQSGYEEQSQPKEEAMSASMVKNLLNKHKQKVERERDRSNGSQV